MSIADHGIQLCFCPPMVDRADPEQHQVGCLEAEARRAHRYWTENPPVWQPFRRPLPTGRGYYPATIPGGCYEASFGWVHVRPGCRCPRS